MIDRFLIATYDSYGKVIDHLSLNLRIEITQQIEKFHLYQFEEQFRSVILKLGVISHKFSKLPEGFILFNIKI